MRVAVVDPQAFTPPYDDELCRALSAAGADVELLTARFTHGRRRSRTATSGASCSARRSPA